MNVARFRHVLRTVLAAAPVTMAACSSEDLTPMPERAECIDRLADTRYLGLTLAPKVDGIALATRGASNFTSDDRTPATRIAPLGTPCSGASDRNACLQKVDYILSDVTTPGWDVQTAGNGATFPTALRDIAAITVGDQVTTATTLNDVLAAATPVTSLQEAATLLQLDGYYLDCSRNNARTESTGWTFVMTDRSCSGEVDEYFYTVGADGSVTPAGMHQAHKKDNGCVEGRRPSNLEATGVQWLSSLPACFAAIAHMEAASVLAFGELEQQLRMLGAPRALLARAARARRDEIAHAAVTARLARRFGAAPAVPHVMPVAVSTSRLVARVALENAVEGCVREAYGALVAAYQARHASDAEIRAVFTQIADDEANHAELSFALERWLAPRLTPAERVSVEAAKARAWTELASACETEPAPEVIAVAGLPPADEARTLLAQLRWASLDTAA